MPALQSKLNPRSEEFKASALQMRQLVGRPQRPAGEDRRGRRRGRARAKHAARGKLLPRDRVEMLLDPDTPFLEIAPLAALDMYDNAAPGGGIIAGIGRVARRRVPDRLQRRHRQGRHLLPDRRSRSTCARRRSRSRTACPASTWSTAAAPTCPTRTRSSPTATTSAASSTTRRRLSALGIPQIAVVMGSCTAGGAYVPAMSDEAIIVKNQGTIFLGGPPLVKAATGEVVSAEDLGGGDVHTRLSGVADHLAENDMHALAHRARQRGQPQLAQARAAAAACRRARRCSTRPSCTA